MSLKTGIGKGKQFLLYSWNKFQFNVVSYSLFIDV